MNILFINPNTTEEFTEKVARVARQYAAPGTVITARTPAAGPRSIEGIYDELLSCAPTLEVALEELERVDAIAIACYSDHPTVYALREITDKPVIGIAEASMLMACMLGYQFSVVTTNEEWVPLLWDAVRHYGLADRCASVRSTKLQVLELESKSDAEIEQLMLEVSRKALEEDGAEVIVLGCAGMSGLDKNLEPLLGVPVVDGVVAALKLLEGTVAYGVRTSKRRAYARPGYKELVNLPAKFSTPYRNGREQ
jgi:allantoin racemase